MPKQVLQQQEGGDTVSLMFQFEINPRDGNLENNAEATGVIGVSETSSARSSTSDCSCIRKLALTARWVSSRPQTPQTRQGSKRPWRAARRAPCQPPRHLWVPAWWLCFGGQLAQETREVLDTLTHVLLVHAFDERIKLQSELTRREAALVQHGCRNQSCA